MNIKTDEELYSKLGDVIDGIESGKIKVVHAVEINNAIGKVIGLRKVQLEEAKMRYLIDAREMKFSLTDQIDREGRALNGTKARK